MDFIDEIKNNLKSINFGSLPYKIFLLGQNGAVVLNVQSINKMDDTFISLKLKNKNLLIQGVNLYLKSFKKGEIYISGQISKVEIML